MITPPKDYNKIKLQNGFEIAYVEYGDPGGKPVFFFHGWPSSRIQGKKHDLCAKKVGIRLICTDRPGYGYSDFQPNRTLLNWPDTICELADHLHIKKFSVLGNSGGGPYAAVCAFALPHRVTSAGIVVGLAPNYTKDMLQGMALQNKII